MDGLAPCGGHSALRALSAALQKDKQKYCDGLAAVLLFFVWELLICGLKQMTASIDDFPAPILAMMVVAAFMILASKFTTDLDDVYRKYLRGPTDLLNRHMSVGFTVPFTMIMAGPMSSSRNIGLIIAGFTITGALNTALVFVFALGMQAALLSIHQKIRSATTTAATVQSAPSMHEQPPQDAPAVRIQSLCSADVSLPALRQTQDQDGTQNRVTSYVSESTTLRNNPSIDAGSDGEAGGKRTPPTHPADDNASQQGPAPAPAPAPAPSLPPQRPVLLARAVVFVAANPVLCCSLVGIPAVGLPVALSTGSDTALDVFVLCALWMGTLWAQAAVKKATFVLGGGGSGGRRRALSPRARAVLATCLNAVLWSSLGTIAYTAAKCAARHASAAEALRVFSTGTTLADLVHPVASASASAPAPARALGAGDLASSILDAGIVSWGLKLFECRAQLLSRGGATTLAAGAVFAVGNIVGGPLLVHAMGLTPAGKALAFAARSVTLALAGPAMANLGGDVGLNAAMVVFNGIVFQVAMGLGACQWAARLMATSAEECQQRIRSGCWRLSRSSGGPDPDAAGGDAETLADNGSSPSAAPSSSSSSSSSTSSTPSPSSFAASSSSVSSSSSSSGPGCFRDVEKTAGHQAAAADGGRHEEARPPPTSYADYMVYMRGGAVRADDGDDDACDSPGTVAAGVTVGINAAAMGTAFLHEDGSPAAPYSVLSMTIFGVMTVVFTSIQPLAGWVVSCVA